MILTIFLTISLTFRKFHKVVGVMANVRLQCWLCYSRGTSSKFFLRRNYFNLGYVHIALN